MEIRFSRHARRRAKLYGIPEAVVENLVTTQELGQGKCEIVEKVTGFQYPIKVVVVIDGDIVTVVTNYPLKKGL
jgi:hypothetical protein